MHTPKEDSLGNKNGKNRKCVHFKNFLKDWSKENTVLLNLKPLSGFHEIP
jgi:hypothetical protein